MDTPARDLATDELRVERDELRAREAALSYRRRLLQGQLDIVRRGDDLDGPADLADVLADAPGVVAEARAVSVTPPEDVELPGLPDLDQLDVAARGDLADQLAATEATVSAERRDVLARLDALQDELVRRYRDDGLDAAAVLDRA